MEDSYLYSITVGLASSSPDNERIDYYPLRSAETDSTGEFIYVAQDKQDESIRIFLQIVESGTEKTDELLIRKEQIKFGDFTWGEKTNESEFSSLLEKNLPNLEDGFRIDIGSTGDFVIGVNESTIESSAWSLWLAQESGDVESIWRVDHPKNAMASELRCLRAMDGRVILAGEWLTQNCSVPLIHIFSNDSKELLSSQKLWLALQNLGICSRPWQDLALDDELQPEGVAIHDVLFDEGRNEYFIAAEYFGEKGFTALLLKMGADEKIELVFQRSESHAAAISALCLIEGELFFAGRTHDGKNYKLFLYKCDLGAQIREPALVLEQELPAETVGDISGLFSVSGSPVLLFALQGEEGWFPS